MYGYCWTIHRGAANIVSHPREIASAARRADDSRKLQRQAKAERKAAEKAKREEETKRLKGQKRRQIEKQLAMLKAEFGEDALDGLDLEGDWDEAKHEAALQKLIGAEDDDVSRERRRQPHVRHLLMTYSPSVIHRRSQHGTIWKAKVRTKSLRKPSNLMERRRKGMTILYQRTTTKTKTHR
jgi:hypothetical protein